MSGIAGLMSRTGEPPAAAALRAMQAALTHRGPDGHGCYRSGDVAMVRTRLAAIDPGAPDRPLYEPGGASLVVDGAIHDRLEPHEASDAGPQPPAADSTRSECEALLHLYRRHGLDFTGHLRGLYAIAVHDPGAGHLVLARDPFGVKPLYYTETAGAFAFASEPRALIAAGLVPAQLFAPARNELVQMQFTTGRQTIFAGIHRVLPGETVVVRRGRVVERRHREALAEGGPLALGEDEALARLDSVLRDSVAIHQPADAPAGVLLSGGVDSTALLLIAAAQAARPVVALTIGLGDAGLADERAAARAAAAAAGAEHLEISFDEGDFWRLLPQIVAAVDDPAADYAILPTYKLAAAARAAGLKQVLSGEGADELFAGYGRYRSALRPWWAGGRVPHARGALDGLGVLRGEIAGWRDGIAAAEARGNGHGRSALQVAQAVDCADWLPNDLLVKLDRCLMAHGVEGRTPYLDPAVAALAFRLPDALKVRKGLGKWLLRRWLAGRLPEARPLERKRGFSVPVARWIARRAERLGPLVAASPGVREICRPEAVEAVFADAAQRRAGRAAWSLLFYALWHRRHIEGRALPPDTVAALAADG